MDRRVAVGSNRLKLLLPNFRRAFLNTVPFITTELRVRMAIAVLRIHEYIYINIFSLKIFFSQVIMSKKLKDSTAPYLSE